MQPGDYVRLKPSDRLSAPWSDYAREGMVMRVRMIDPRRRKAVSIQPADSPSKSFRHDWFGEDDLEPWEREPKPDFRERLEKLRTGGGKVNPER